MYEMNRIRLVNVGPAKARYHDVVLDLSGAGEPLTPEALFDDGRRRPAPASLLILANGGGKGVLLKLVFSVLLASRNHTVGRADLDDFVQGSDPAHVVIEWMDVRTGERVLTGKISQRKSSTASERPVDEGRYLAHVRPGLDLESLPIVQDGRRVRMAGFKEALYDAAREDPTIALVWPGGVREWRQTLQQQGIDPDLWDIQRHMNVEEGEAAKTFAFANSAQAVDWLLGALVDPEDMAPVAADFRTYAATLADRTKMLAEKDFITQALPVLKSVVDSHDQRVAAQHALVSAMDDAARLGGAVSARSAAHRARHCTLVDRLAEASEAADRLDKECRLAASRKRELDLVVAELQLEQCQQSAEALTQRLADAKASAEAWRLVAHVAERDEAQEAINRLGEILNGTNQERAALLEQRDRDASALITLLEHLAEAADEQARLAGEQVVQAEKDIEVAEAKVADHTSEAAVASERARVAREAVATAQADIVAAIDEGLVSAQTTLEQVPQLAEQATAAASAGAQAVERARREERAAAQAVDEVVNRQAQSVKEQARAHQTHSDAQKNLTDLTSRAAEIWAMSPVHELLGDSEGDGGDDAGPSVDEVDRELILDEAADRVLIELAALRDSAQTQLRRLERDHDQISEITNKMSTGQLLPARPDVLASVERLERAGIRSHTGWSYLAETEHADRRAELIAAHPEIVDGVIVPDPTDLAAARQALADPPLLPDGAVTVASGDALHSPNAPGTAGAPDTFGHAEPQRFVIEPNPALYDVDAAERRHADLERQAAILAARAHELRERAQSLETARHQLAMWCQDFPAGEVARCRERMSTAVSALERAEEAVVAADERVQAARAAHELARAVTEQEGVAAAAVLDRSRELAQLARQVSAALEAQGGLDELVARERGYREAIQVATRELAHARRALAEANAVAAEARSTATGHRESIAGVACDRRYLLEVVPSEPLAALQRRAVSSNERLGQHVSDPNLQGRLASAHADLKAAQSVLAQADPAIVTLAEEYLGQAGHAGSVRNRRRDAAVEAFTRLERERDGVQQELGAAQAARDAARPSRNPFKRWCELPPRWMPDGLEHARELSAVAERELDGARGREASSQAAVSALSGQIDVSEQVGREIEDALEVLAEDVSPKAGVEALAEEVNPREAARRARAGIREARRVDKECQDAERRAVDEVRVVATSYETVETTARQSLQKASYEVLTGRAAEWTIALEQRLVSLSHDIDAASRYRSSLVEMIAGHVDHALKLLRDVQRFSRLPESLPGGGGQDFLRIRSKNPDADTLRLRLGEMTDRLADEQVNGTKADRGGMALLTTAVRAAVPDGFEVTVLQPDPALKIDYHPIANMARVFSGGQELTAAILLYCTLAAVRTNARGRGRGRDKHAGVLFLDNPIGRANAAYLLAMQHQVAKTQGVQLIYTTGINDDRVSATFPLWVRMRNDADLRSGKMIVSVAEAARPLLSGLADSDTPDGVVTRGQVTASRVYRRTSSGGDA